MRYATQKIHAFSLSDDRDMAGLLTEFAAQHNAVSLRLVSVVAGIKDSGAFVAVWEIDDA